MSGYGAMAIDTGIDTTRNRFPEAGKGLSVTDVLAATGGTLLSGNESAVFDSVEIDSRTFPPGALFVAIRGENHDGHAFLAEVIRQGARGVLVDDETITRKSAFQSVAVETACIAVSDTTRALGDLAAYQRRQADIRVVAITGSNGKTTTRCMTAAVFGRRFNTLASPGNFNNEIGLPLTLFRLKPRHQWAVVELGMNHFNEIRRLSAICRPDIGIITTIAPCHLAGVGSIEGVVKAKSELLENIRSGGTVILNRDDPHLARLGARAAMDVLFFGESEKADIRARSIRETPGGIDFVLELPGSRTPVRLPAVGRFMVVNALAAAAAGYLAGISGEEIGEGLSRYRPESGRLTIVETDRGVTIIDDTYNANPASMAAAIDTLVNLAGRKRSILVMGDMLELGKESGQLHRATGELAGRSGISRIYITGTHADDVAAGARSGGLKKNRIITGETKAVIADLKNLLQAGDFLLVKGSRGSAMERVVTPIRDWATEKKPAAK
ncbi:MAG: UDP-N-acetylmuramoyl-tripeptide--D-alanyl-D-alanine ligase [Deltaproteobacteria bacterium]|nr:MAG: UDP-N-acetylmuramoyl-tripeptide--D-alanyl-D-alanine ligase [Deltaproteobacteria bacterium]